MAKMKMPVGMMKMPKMTGEEKEDQCIRTMRWEGPNGPTREGLFGKNDDLGFGKQLDRANDDIPRRTHADIMRRDADGEE